MFVKLLVRQPPGLPDLFLRPCICLVGGCSSSERIECVKHLLALRLVSCGVCDAIYLLSCFGSWTACVQFPERDRFGATFLMPSF